MDKIELSADDLMRQAWSTSHDYYINLRGSNALKHLSDDQIIQLVKVAAIDFATASLTSSLQDLAEALSGE